MKCPHCLVTIHEKWNTIGLGVDANLNWSVSFAPCPACKKFIIHLLGGEKANPAKIVNNLQVYPKGIARTPLSPVVPENYTGDYQEACQVIIDSPKASAALSRRCLQKLLRDIGKVKPSDLSKEIDEILDSQKLPSHLSEAIDAIRNIGNFAAHPIKSTNSGEIVDIEIGEAEWLLDVLEGLIDFYFVQPDLSQKKKEALNKKLTDAGKPPMK